jgi:hypothetical protein
VKVGRAESIYKKFFALTVTDRLMKEIDSIEIQ